MSITAGSVAGGRLSGWQPARVRAPKVRLAQDTSRKSIAWGRVVALLTILLTTAALAALLGAGIRAVAQDSAPVPVRSDDGASVAGVDRMVVGPDGTAMLQHSVQPGDTLWALAQRVDPGADPRPTIERIISINGLAGAEVEVGRLLLLPTQP